MERRQLVVRMRSRRFAHDDRKREEYDGQHACKAESQVRVLAASKCSPGRQQDEAERGNHRPIDGLGKLDAGQLAVGRELVARTSIIRQTAGAWLRSLPHARAYRRL